MQTVVTIEFNGQTRLIQAATPEEAVAELIDQYQDNGGAVDVDLSALTIQCVTSIDTYPTWEEFEAEFKPATNHLDTNASFDGQMFETYGDERTFVDAQPPDHVWTIVEDGTGDLTLISPGFHFVNRIGYIVTEIPWQEGQEEFLG